MTTQDWGRVKHLLSGKLSDEESHILNMLIDGKSTVEIGRILGQHRSMVWRKTDRIRKRALPT